MEGVFMMILAGSGFGLMLLAVYFPLCIWRYADYKKRGGRKGLWRYINENC